MPEFYAGSDGAFYTEWEVSWRFESGEWDPCMWGTDAGWELVEGEDGLVWLWPVERSRLPDGVEIRAVQPGPGLEIVDHRGTVED